MEDNNQGFPSALTHENLAAALKRIANELADAFGEYGSKITIADLREQLQARDQTIADLQTDLQNWKDRALSKSEGAWEG